MLTNPVEHRKGILSLILLAVVFASMGLFARYLATGFLIFQQVYLRMFAAFIIGAIAFHGTFTVKKLTHVPVKDWIIIIFRAVSYALFGITLFSQAIILTKYSNVSFIGALPTTAVLGFIILREKFSFQKAGFVLLASLGALVLAVSDYAHVFSWGRGEVLTLISNVFFALSYIARRWQSTYLTNKELTVLNFFVAFIVVFLVSLGKGDGLPLSGWTIGLLLAVIGAGCFNVLNVFLTNYGFEKVEAVLASNILTLESFFAVGFGFMFFREVSSFKELAGGSIIIASIIGMNFLEKKEK